MHEHLESIYHDLKLKYPYQKEYLQSVLEFFESINNVLLEDPKIIESNVIRNIVEPDRIITFKVPWVDDKGKNRFNTGYRVQFNQALGPYKGGIRFTPNVNESVLKFLGFEQTFKNSLTGLPLGGGKGGSDFNPKNKSDAELLRFCQSFMIELHRHLGPTLDVPAGDIGVSQKAIGYMFGMYKRLTHAHHGSFTGKGTNYGGSLGRTEATGYGIIYMTLAALDKYFNTDLKNITIIISGSGNVALHTAYKAKQMGANVVAMSSIDGVIYHPQGIDVALLEHIKEHNQLIEVYLERYPNAVFSKDTKKIWEIPCEIALPCATENELELEDVKKLVKNGLKMLVEGANMPTTLDATHYLLEHNILFIPGKAANAGGVSVSGLEMQQNALHTSWTFETVDNKLKEIMTKLFNSIYETAKSYDKPFDLVSGANILSFKRIYQAMLDQGL
ncbi:NADP-specific glutamate dehydrogenase [Acholeplasma granularum]|uniref:NADP-specific glutamate dehydrogenase n=1 Tax=Acholeplasma granularum TaxID=264635 RepID=UPI000470517F|nr:NADP-specific glutamate dehydrogenase [Acholeplasma granularum]